MAALVGRRDVLLREVASQRNWILGITDDKKKEEFQEVRLLWRDNIPGSGPHPWGSLDSYCWSFFLSGHAPDDDSDSTWTTSCALLDRNKPSFSKFTPVLPRPIARGPPEGGVWLWKLSFNHRSMDDRDTSECYAQHREFFTRYGDWRVDAAPETRLARELREAFQSLRVRADQ